MQEKEDNKTEQEPMEEAMNQATDMSEEQVVVQEEPNKMAELQQQLDESRSKYLYLFSDFENYRRNAARERIELMSTAGRDIMSALLPILDDFDRASKNAELSEGTILIHQKLINTLKTKGLKATEVSLGDAFDADLHEAILEIPAPTEDLQGKIVDIIEQGYTLGEKNIRFAKVVVGK
jgi:molecular chaperone GrpE